MNIKGNNIMNNIFMKYLVLFCIIYTVATILSCCLQLSMGQFTDTNLHLINRAIVIVILVLTIALIFNLSLKFKPLNYIIPYVISMPLVFSYVWMTGFLEELHRNAYVDIFLNYSIGYIIVIIVIIIIKNRFWNK